MNYQQYVMRFADMCDNIQSDADFANVIPATIEAAEARCYRDLNLLATIVRDSSASTAANTRLFTLPQAQGRFVAVQRINVVTPSGSTVSNGSRNLLTRTAPDLVEMIARAETAASSSVVPQCFAMITDQTIILAPSPGAVFQVEVVGTIQPTALSASNTTTFLSLYLPDLFLAASVAEAAPMVPKLQPQAALLEGRYMALLGSALTLETRRRFDLYVNSDAAAARVQ